MKIILQITPILIILLLIGQKLLAQACCTAGTPLLGSLEMTTAPRGALQFGLTFEHNSLKDVFDGNNQLLNPERERISESALLEVNYGISNRLSITGMFSFISQERTISTLSNTENTLSARGIGDIVLLSKYSLIEFDIFDKQILSFGSGIKFPIGSSSLKNKGILLPADMQPGSGSWDGIFWGFYSVGDFLFPDLILLSNVSYRLNGNNDRFESSSKGYRFGNEFIVSVGISYPLISNFDFSTILKYRNTQNDSFGNQNIPNTGGNWIYFFPGITYYLNEQISTRLDGELPIFTNVSGTQLTTTFTASVSFFYTINLFEGSY
jgi:hypothetical protein